MTPYIIEYIFTVYIYIILGLIKPRDCIKWIYMLAGIQDWTLCISRIAGFQKIRKKSWKKLDKSRKSHVTVNVAGHYNIEKNAQSFIIYYNVEIMYGLLYYNNIMYDKY